MLGIRNLQNGPLPYLLSFFICPIIIFGGGIILHYLPTIINQGFNLTNKLKIINDFHYLTLPNLFLNLIPLHSKDYLTILYTIPI